MSAKLKCKGFYARTFIIQTVSLRGKRDAVSRPMLMAMNARA